MDTRKSDTPLVKGASKAEEDSFTRPLFSLPEQIANAINEQILRGRIAPGENIPEQKLSAIFRVSRGPVREALRILEREGVVVVLPRRGAQVTKLSVAELLEIYQIRAELFALAARLFAERKNPEHLAEIRRKLRQMRLLWEAGGSADEHGAISTAMTQILCAGCGNARLSQMVQTLGRQIERYTVIGLSTVERRKQSVENWQMLIDAMEAGNIEVADRIARMMVQQAIDHAIPRLK